MFRLISLTLKLGYNIQDMRREKRKDSPNAVSLVLRDRSGCFGLSFPFLNLNQNIRLKSLHHNHDDRLQEALSHVKSLNLTRRERHKLLRQCYGVLKSRTPFRVKEKEVTPLTMDIEHPERSERCLANARQDKVGCPFLNSPRRHAPPSPFCFSSCFRVK
jgi:hypothetical protein